MEEVLNSQQIDQFIEEGFIRIDNAFPEELAAEVRNILWKDMDADPNEDPGDTGWHVDVSFGEHTSNFLEWRANWRSKNRGLLMLFLYSDIGEMDAPTRIRVGSHLDIARLLKPHGEQGLSLLELIAEFDSMPKRKEIQAAGKAGTVYLCHPFLVHAAQPHHGKEPRFLAQPPLLLKNDLMRESNTANFSPVEMAIQFAPGK